MSATSVVLDTDTGKVVIGNSTPRYISLLNIDTLITHLDMAGDRVFEKAGIIVYRITLEGIELAITALMQKSHTKG